MAEAIKYTKLPPVFKKNWMSALRSKKYKQTTKQVCRDEKDGSHTFCCIGVGGMVCGYSTDDIGRSGILSIGLKKVPRSFGEPDLQGHLIDMNDGRGEYKDNPQSFEQIADWVEVNL